ncbi:MAG: hypothetical protein PHG82_04500 [Candidatus Gracilibacteria bacterium]|nr:hypothetical protein [Candidatus Gracilibacteria bacterium]
MYNLELTRKREEKLDLIKNNDKNLFSLVISELSDIKNNGLKSKNTKNIGDNIFRKRIGRWRILFTIKNLDITIWIIDIEKDTLKDYKKWKEYVISKM